MGGGQRSAGGAHAGGGRRRGIDAAVCEHVGPMAARRDRSRTSGSAVSRRFVALSTKRLGAILGRALGEADQWVVYIDGKVFRDHCMVLALGIDAEGRKHVRGQREGSAETAAVSTGLLSDLVTRGLPTDRRSTLDASVATASCRTGSLLWKRWPRPTAWLLTWCNIDECVWGGGTAVERWAEGTGGRTGVRQPPDVGVGAVADDQRHLACQRHRGRRGGDDRQHCDDEQLRRAHPVPPPSPFAPPRPVRSVGVQVRLRLQSDDSLRWSRLLASRTTSRGILRRGRGPGTQGNSGCDRSRCVLRSATVASSVGCQTCRLVAA